MSSKPHSFDNTKTIQSLKSGLASRVCKFDILAIFSDKIDSHRTKEIESHLERCSECRAALERLDSSTPDWWDDAKDSWLEEDITIMPPSQRSVVTLEVGIDLPEDTPLELERVSLNFLEEPSHPELMGRLGRFDIERVIGVGGMGIVLKAFDTELHRVVALKVLARHLANNASARRRFAREAQAAAAVLHPNVIPIYNVESESDNPFLVMQYVNGQSLQAKVDEQGPLSIAEALRIAKQTAAGLAAAHQQGLVHRDVKPANILLEENVDRVLLSDFGLARAVDDASLTRTGIVAGTPHYMSPEQARGDALSFASDLFSLGSVMYFMLSGHPPFRAQNAMGVLNRICHDPHRPLDQTNASIPVEVAAIVDRLLDKNPIDRFASMSQVEQEMDSLLTALQAGGLSLRRDNVRKQSDIGSEKAFHWKRPLTWFRAKYVRSTVMLVAASIVLFACWRVMPERLRSKDNSISGSLNSPVNVLQEYTREERAWQSNWDNSLQQLEQQMRSAESPNSTTVISSEDSFEYERSIMEIQRKIQALEEDDPWSMFQSRFPNQP
ncbi:MAG: serine/threonine-protein kinase [Pirellula sp.]